MVEIEIIREFKCCWKVGQRKEVQDYFAEVLIEGGYAKRIEKALKRPVMNKMIDAAPIEK